MVYSCEVSKDTELPDIVCKAIRGSVCTMGVFDGMHRGHIHIEGIAVKLALSTKRRCVCITFDIDPDEMFVPGFTKIMANDKRIEALSQAGFDDVIVLHFTPAFSELPADAFLDRIFDACEPYAIVVADDFRFGHRAKGTVADLREWGSMHGVEIRAVDLLTEGGMPVTSTRIRHLLRAGDVEGANGLLGHPFAFGSIVLEGRHAGRDMGFKTANLRIPEDLSVLKPGVYAGRAIIDGLRYKAAVSVGVSPTFADEATANVEVHVLDYDGDLYGKTIEVEIVCRLRDMIKFDDIDALISQVTSDISYVRDSISIQ